MVPILSLGLFTLPMEEVKEVSPLGIFFWEARFNHADTESTLEKLADELIPEFTHQDLNHNHFNHEPANRFYQGNRF